MGGLKKVVNRFSAIAILKNAIIILGCVLFLISALYPFYRIDLWNPGGGTISQLWSFKNETVGYDAAISSPFPELNQATSLWFFDYWFSSNLSARERNLSVFGISWVLPMLFAIQAITLAFGVASVIFKKRILSFLPVLFTLTVILLAMYANSIARASAIVRLGNGSFFFALGEYQLGYYLAYPSLAIFLFIVTLNEVTRIGRPQNTEI
jgi:hypothetical protein